MISFEIKYIMLAKNFTEEQAKNFYKHYEGYCKCNFNVSLDEFIERNGGVSPIISQDILNKVEKL